MNYNLNELKKVVCGIKVKSAKDFRRYNKANVRKEGKAFAKEFSQKMTEQLVKKAEDCLNMKVGQVSLWKKSLVNSEGNKYIIELLAERERGDEPTIYVVFEGKSIVRGGIRAGQFLKSTDTYGVGMFVSLDEVITLIEEGSISTLSKYVGYTIVGAYSMVYDRERTHLFRKSIGTDRLVRY